MPLSLQALTRVAVCQALAHCSEMSKASERERELTGRSDRYTPADNRRDEALRALCWAWLRYGRAQSDAERKQCADDIERARVAYEDQREADTRIVSVEYVLHAAGWLERNRRCRQSTGAQWSTEKCAG